MYPYGLIGNGQCTALVSDRGSVDWLCLPRPDSPPWFGRLLDPAGGHFQIEPAGLAKSTQRYLPNTNILETRFDLPGGEAFRIIDFCPRFPQYGRMFRPLSLFRIVEPLQGSVFLKATVRAVDGWEKQPLDATRGNSHLRFVRGNDYLRLATNLSLTSLTEGGSFGLKQPLYFALTFNATLKEDLASVCRESLRRTREYWETWVKHCRIPYRHQGAVIRSALALKLHCYDDTGAILAALTTSLPEERGKQRNWDYRFCWLRDAHFTLRAFHHLGHFEEAEAFLGFLLDLAHTDATVLKPVYRLDQTLPLPELVHPAWTGLDGAGSVRSGNQAAEHIQNDAYGEMALTLAPLFLDQRFEGMRHRDHEQLFSLLAARCAESVGQPDAGLWELRHGWRDHSFTNLMCWAGLDRALTLKHAGFLKDLTVDLEAGRTAAAEALRRATVNGALGAGYGDPSADASLLLASVLRYPDQALCRATTELVRAQLKAGEGPEGFLYRYRYADDFGKPASAFVICSFWLVQALAREGQLAAARGVMEQALKACNPLGLLSEHFDPVKSAQLGNFPQAYSHVGLIHAALAVSEPWDEVL
jgi:GH15 family glucan-1,4-alpha-glucosidase